MRKIILPLVVVLLLLGMSMFGCNGGGDGNGGNGYVPQPPSPAAFTVVLQSLEPTVTNPNEQTTLTVSITNTGSSQGTHNVILEMDGAQVASETITLSVGSSQTITFNVTSESLGEHYLTIGGQSFGSFEVIRGILFVSNRNGNYEIYSMWDDGSNVVQLTNNSAIDADPSWSPDGQRIAFS